jgi:hypothetical protein
MRWATRVVALAIDVVLIHALAAAARAQTPVPDGTPSSDGGGLGIDVGALAKAIGDAVSTSFGKVLTDVLTKSLPALIVTSLFTAIGTIGRWVHDGMSQVFDQVNVITQTPDSLAFFGLPSVSEMFRGLSGVAFALVGPVVVLAGFGIMARSMMGGTFPELLELLPRLGIALVWVVATPLWFPLALDFTNAVCRVIGGAATPVPGWATVGGFDDTTAQGVFLLVYSLAGMFLFLQSLIRIAVMNIAVVLTPLAMLCWVVPQWRWLYSIWVRVLVAAFITQILQTLALGMGAGLMASITGNVGADSVAAALLTVAIGLATILAAWSLPKQVVGAYGPGLTLPQALLTAVATGAAVARGVSVAGAAAAGIGTAAGAAGIAAGSGVAGAAAGMTSIVPLPPPPAGASLPVGGAAGPSPFPPISGFPGG